MISQMTPLIKNLYAESIESKNEFKRSKLTVYHNNAYHFISLSDISFLEADGNYTSIHLFDGETLVASKTLKSLFQSVSYASFIKVHAKYIINLNFIERLYRENGNTIIDVNGYSLPVSRSHLSKLKTTLNV